jgi:hypothetical protein
MDLGDQGPPKTIHGTRTADPADDASYEANGRHQRRDGARNEVEYPHEILGLRHI